MSTKSFRFQHIGFLPIEGIGALHASFTLLLNVTEEDVKEGKKLFMAASMLCNAAKANGSGQVIPWCSVQNNIDNKKYALDAKRKSFALTLDEILIGSTEFTIPYKKNMSPVLTIKAGYFLDTGYTGSIPPTPAEVTNRISLQRFK